MEKRSSELIDELKKRLDVDREEIKGQMKTVLGNVTVEDSSCFEVYARLAGEINKNNQLFLELIRTRFKEVDQKESKTDEISDQECEEIYKELS